MRTLLVVLVVWCSITAAEAEVIEIPGASYHLNLPKKFDPQKTYYLYVAVHGLRWTGAMADKEAGPLFKRRQDVILVGPDMPWGQKGKDMPATQTGPTIMEAMLKDLRGKYKLHPKFYLVGFSAGGSFVQSYMARHAAEILGLVWYGQYPPRTWRWLDVPVLACAGEKENMEAHLKAFVERVNKAGGYAAMHIAPGAGHDITDTMRQASFDLLDKCLSGVSPRLLDQIAQQFGVAAQAEAAGKQKEAAVAYKAILALGALPAETLQKARDGFLRVVLADLQAGKPELLPVWETGRQSVLKQLAAFDNFAAFQKITNQYKYELRGTELANFFVEAESAGQAVQALEVYLKLVTEAKEKNRPAPPQKPLNAQIAYLTKKITWPDLRAAVRKQAERLPEPMGN